MSDNDRFKPPSLAQIHELKDGMKSKATVKKTESDVRIVKARGRGKHPFSSFDIYVIELLKTNKWVKKLCKSDLPFRRYRTSKFEVYL